MTVRLAAITLPDDIQWTDEYAGHGVGQTITPTLTGALLVEEAAQQAGRPITLASNGAAWLERSTVEALQALAATPLDTGDTHTLIWGDGRTFQVVFDRSSGPAIEAQEVLRAAAQIQGADHPYTVTIRLITA
ncbi:MAG: hypothetical protein ACOC0M_00325 [Halomonas sp.]